jgi:hypothetical protein
MPLTRIFPRNPGINNDSGKKTMNRRGRIEDRKEIHRRREYGYF